MIRSELMPNPRRMPQSMVVLSDRCSMMVIQLSPGWPEAAQAPLANQMPTCPFISRKRLVWLKKQLSPFISQSVVVQVVRDPLWRLLRLNADKAGASWKSKSAHHLSNQAARDAELPCQRANQLSTVSMFAVIAFVAN